MRFLAPRDRQGVARAADGSLPVGDARHQRRTLGTVPVLLAVIAVFVAAINLRAGIASLGPVLGGVLDAFDAAGWLAGVVTAIPGLFFALMGLAAVPLARRLGLSTALTAGMVLTLIGLAVRPWVGQIWVFIVLTAFVVAGIALANVLLPAWIKNHGRRRTVALMTVYTGVLGVSGAVGPLSALFFHGEDSWRWALFVWASFAAVQVVVWVIVSARTGFDFPSVSVSGAEPGGSLWRAPTAVFLMAFFGLQSMNAYVQMGWLPQIYIDSGAPASVGAVALALIGALNIVGGLVMPFLISRVHNLTLFPVLFSAFSATGYLGLYVAADLMPLLWALLLGLGGFCFPTALALIAARSRTALVTARLSGFVQPFGYFVAAAGPLLVGIVYDITGQWSVILLALVAGTVAMALAGFRASRPGYIDDELAAPTP
ncbi:MULTISPECIES: MFS transporter [Citricoccus]|uniref:MFS transporter n=1 Tax=Citricoccus TaxID=169133 RepID=UPI000255F460|nr:MFS transporter [Citricoccus sp. CH26A]